MTFKSLTTFVIHPEHDLPLLDSAASLAATLSAHLDVYALGLDRTVAASYYAGANAVILDFNTAAARADAKTMAAAAKARLTGVAARYVVNDVLVYPSGMGSLVAQSARFSELVITALPYEKNLGREYEEVLEAVLYSAQLPALVVPAKTAGAALGPFATISVAWNESPEALRAVRAALPLLKAAEKVHVVLVDPSAHSLERSDPGGALTQMLARQGVNVEVSVLAKTLPHVSDVLLRHCNDVGSDLLVMGAYGHSRFRQSILGGATRNMLTHSPRPVLMAH